MIWTENLIHTVSEIKKRKTLIGDVRQFKWFNLTKLRFISDIFQRADPAPPPNPCCFIYATKCNICHDYHQKLAQNVKIKRRSQQRAFITCIMEDEKAGGLTKWTAGKEMWPVEIKDWSDEERYRPIYRVSVACQRVCFISHKHPKVQYCIKKNSCRRDLLLSSSSCETPSAQHRCFLLGHWRSRRGRCVPAGFPFATLGTEHAAHPRYYSVKCSQQREQWASLKPALCLSAADSARQLWMRSGNKRRTSSQSLLVLGWSSGRLLAAAFRWA